MLVRGDKLKPAARAEVLRRYAYRWTRDNAGRVGAYGTCPVCKVPGGLPEPTLRDESRLGCRQYHPVVSLTTDAEWLAGHAFHVTRNGDLDEQHSYAEPAFMAEDQR